MVYCGAEDYYIFALKPDGNAVWSFGTRYLLESSLA